MCFLGCFAYLFICLFGLVLNRERRKEHKFGQVGSPEDLGGIGRREKHHQNTPHKKNFFNTKSFLKKIYVLNETTLPASINSSIKPFIPLVILGSLSLFLPLYL